VFLPSIASRIEQPKPLLRDWVCKLHEVTFEEIARATGERLVAILAGTSAFRRKHMFNLEGKVKDCFGSMAILTAVHGPR